MEEDIPSGLWSRRKWAICGVAAALVLVVCLIFGTGLSPANPAGTPVTFSNTIPLTAQGGQPIAEFRNGIADGNGVVEVTLLQRVAA